jgi:organic radical activating enzyme
MKLTYADTSKENWFLVAWTLSNKCNYRCSYCPSYLNDGSTGQPEWPIVEQFVKGFSIPSKTICYRISGGEPTYWKHFLDLAKLVKSKGHQFTFLTNGSQTVEYYKEISKFADGIIISYHDEYADIDHIINVANAVECVVVVNLMMVQDKFDRMVEIGEKLYSGTTKLAIWPKVVLDKTSGEFVTNNVSDYTDEQKSIIKSWPYFRKIDDSQIHRGSLLLDNLPVTGNDIIVKGLNNYKGWSCWAGLDMLSIDMWGDIYRSECKQGGKLGNLENYTLPTEPITCPANKCSCLSDIYLQKESKVTI